MRVLIPSALLSYTSENWVEAAGGTVAEVVNDLDAQFPGIRFRMINEQGNLAVTCAADGEMAHELSHPLRADGELLIVQALSGG